MMEAAQNGQGDDFPVSTKCRCGAFGAFGNALADALMWPGPVEVRDVLLEDPPQMGFAQDQDMVEAFAANTPQQPLADGVRAWCLDRRAQHLDSAAHRDGIEVRTIFRIVVANQVLRRDAKERL